MKKRIIFCAIVLLALGSLLFYYILPFHSGDDELRVSDLDIPEGGTLTWGVNLSDMDFTSELEGGMYLIKSISGGLEVSLRDEKGGAMLRVSPPDSPRLDHTPAYIMDISQNVKELPALRLREPEGDVRVYPRFQLEVNVLIIEKFVLPHKLRYVWTLVYDAELKQLCRFSGGNIIAKDSIQSIPFAHVVDYSVYDEVYVNTRTLTRRVDEDGKLQPRAQGVHSPHTSVAFLYFDGGYYYDKGLHRAKRRFADAHAGASAPTELLYELTKETDQGQLEEEILGWNNDFKIRYAILHGTPARLWTLAWKKGTTAALPDPMSAGVKEGENIHYSYDIPMLGTSERIPVLGINLNESPDDVSFLITPASWKEVPAYWGWKGIKRVYHRRLTCVYKNQSREPHHVHIINAYEDETGAIYELTWIPEPS